jgi:DNA-binding protein YbaB
MMEKFSQMKNLYALKKQADEMKKKMEQIVVTVEEGQYEIVIRGDQTIEAVRENGEERNDLKKAFNKALKESQKVVAKKMRNQMGDLGLGM